MDDISAGIAQLVAEGWVQGSRLAQEVRSRYPNWSASDAGARNLKDFVERFVDGVEVVDRAGMDVVYGLSGSASSERNSPKVPSNRPANVGPANFWRIWLSPNSPFAIAIDRASGSVVAIAREVDADDLTAKLEPPSQARHLEIAREFVQGIEGEAANELTAILDNGGDDWWQPWFRKVQSIGAGERWHRHRTFAFEAVLKDSLQSLGLTTPIFDRVFATISKDRFARRPAVHTGSPAIDRELSDRGALLRVVAAAVQQMSVSDLRDLKLPVGIVLDVIHRDRI